MTGKPLRGRTLTDEHKQKIADALRGKPKSDETKQKLSAATTKSMTEERRRQIGDINRGKPSPKRMPERRTPDGKLSPTYWSWMGIRCRPESSYSQRGITMCSRWKAFVNFLADMGERPSGKTLDRINNDGNYEPGNCRWATGHEQRLNSRNPKRGFGSTVAPTARLMKPTSRGDKP